MTRHTVGGHGQSSCRPVGVSAYYWTTDASAMVQAEPMVRESTSVVQGGKERRLREKDGDGERWQSRTASDNQKAIPRLGRAEKEEREKPWRMEDEARRGLQHLPAPSSLSPLTSLPPPPPLTASHLESGISKGLGLGHGGHQAAAPNVAGPVPSTATTTTNPTLGAKRR